MEKFIKIIEKEIKKAETLCEAGDPQLYETEAEYRAYIDGLEFALNKITDTLYVTSPSRWIVKFTCGTVLQVKAGDVTSCLNKVILLNYNTEEIVSMECFDS